MQNRLSLGSLLLAAPLCALAFAIAIAPAGAAWDGKQTINLGDQLEAELTGGGEVHQLWFFAPAGTAVSTSLKSSGGVTVKLYTITGVEVADGTTTMTGWHFLEVSGNGAYAIKTKAKFPKKMTATTDSGEYEFGAIGGSLLSASAKGGTIDSLEGPGGDIAITAGAKIKKVALPDDGHYVLGLTEDTDVTVSVSVKAPKSKRKWSMGAVEEPTGVPTGIRTAWMGSGHADFTAEAFRHWDEDGAVSTSCARCHSSYGYQDFLGADGSAAGSIEKAADLGSTVDCNACHNDAALVLDTVTFPSGQTATGLGPEARCMTCHQGRESTVSLNDHIAGAVGEGEAPLGPDDLDSDLRFRNIHYFAAGATLYGGAAMGAYQYDGMMYDARNPHVASHDTCIDCHNVHTLEVKIDECADCHAGVASVEDLHDVRMAGSVRDYNGNGNTDEGVYMEIMGLGNSLYAAMQEYATDVVGTGIVYDSHSYPYWFTDTGARYSTWTPRLLRAAYNYQYWQKDPGAFAHNPKYTIEFLYDSIADLNSHAMVDTPNFAKMVRNDSGHFDAGAEAFRHWDEEEDDGMIENGTVSSRCVRCHTPDGFDFYAEYGLDLPKSAAIGDGMKCETCHQIGADFTAALPALKVIDEVEFPSGEVIDNDNNSSSFLCMSCHKGRSAGTNVDADIADDDLGFSNVHYLPAGATIYGADAAVGYQYAGKSYDGKWGDAHPVGSECATCHLIDHTFKPQVPITTCGCHAAAGGDVEMIRTNRATDYDGDGNNTEKLKDEVMTFGDRLYAAILAHAKDVVGVGIVYDSAHHPYWFQDADNDGVADLDGEDEPIEYDNWDAALMKGTFNYQYWKKEPGAWAHNTNYILQILFDSIEDLAGNLTGLTRP